MEAKILRSVNILKKKRAEINKQIDDFYFQLNEIKTFDFILSDHALIRYLQRVELISVSEARYKILEQIQNFFEKNKHIDRNTLKNVAYKLRIGDVIYVITDNKIITVEVSE